VIKVHIKSFFYKYLTAGYDELVKSLANVLEGRGAETKTEERYEDRSS